MRGATSHDDEAPGDEKDKNGQESYDPEKDDKNADEPSDGGPESDADDENETPATSPQAARGTSPTESSGGLKSKMSAGDTQKKKDLDARARAAEAAKKELYARLIAAEKVASEMTKTAEENQALRIAAENAALKNEIELLRQSATTNTGTSKKKSGDEAKDADGTARDVPRQGCRSAMVDDNSRQPTKAPQAHPAEDRRTCTH